MENEFSEDLHNIFPNLTIISWKVAKLSELHKSMSKLELKLKLMEKRISKQIIFGTECHFLLYDRLTPESIFEE